MKIGYARVSTQDQNLDLQRDALKAAGCSRIVEDTASGGKRDRSGLERVREQLRQGDVLVVWRMDRLARSLKHLIDLMSELEEQGIGFQSVTEAIDTTSPSGKLVFHIFGALAEFERNLIRDRTKAGLEAHGHAAGKGAGRRSWTPKSAPWPSSSTGRRSIPSRKSAQWSASASRPFMRMCGRRG
jgi:DNA invertase Pin-like site-specific DNA recombinase